MRQFQDLVKAGWDVSVQGCKMLQTVKKLTLLNKRLKQLNLKHFSNILNEADKCREMLKKEQKQLQDQTLNLEFQEEERVRHSV